MKVESCENAFVSYELLRARAGLLRLLLARCTPTAFRTRMIRTLYRQGNTGGSEAQGHRVRTYCCTRTCLSTFLSISMNNQAYLYHCVDLKSTSLEARQTGTGIRHGSVLVAVLVATARPSPVIPGTSVESGDCLYATYTYTAVLSCTLSKKRSTCQCNIFSRQRFLF